jgi:transcriptional regulator with XRE-family HTH domain
MEKPVTTFLRDRRKSRYLTAADLAARVGVHPMSILRWERRDRLPGPSHIRRLARSLAVETAEVASFFDDVRPPGKYDADTVRGHGLRPLRHTARVSVTRLAAAAGVPAATVYNWESGRARVPHRHLPALAEQLGLDAPALRRFLAAAPAAVTVPGPPPSELRRLRRRVGLSQAEVAARIGAGRHSVSAWERGQRPPLAAVRLLARVYGVPVARVAGAAGVSPPRQLDRRTWAPGDLPEVLEALRLWAGMTQADVAERMSCSVASVRAWENARGVPGRTLRLRLERLYGLPEGDLLRAYPAR